MKQDFYKVYTGTNKNNVTCTGSDYYKKDKTLLMDLIIKQLPVDMGIIDAYDSITFIQEMNSITFYKEVFDIDFLKQNSIYPWNYVYRSLFSKVGHSSFNQTDKTFSEVKHTLHDAIKVLPHYKEALLTAELNDYLKYNDYAKKVFCDNIQHMTIKVCKDLQENKVILNKLKEKNINIKNIDNRNHVIEYCLSTDFFNDIKFDDPEDYKYEIKDIFKVDNIIDLLNKHVFEYDDMLKVINNQTNIESIFHKIMRYYRRDHLVSYINKNVLNNEFYFKLFISNLTSYQNVKNNIYYQNNQEYYNIDIFQFIKVADYYKNFVNNDKGSNND